ncbi:MAG: hypothetical protein NC429_10140 [Lachnospiraceae bacterium]|nr:hypothetical protein [Lachnospiraceae bacterium]
MFLMNKKILYLSVYHGNQKGEPAGFIRFTERQRECRMEIQVKKAPDMEECTLLFYAGNEEIPVCPLPVQAGRISFEKNFPRDGENVLLRGIWYDSRRISQIGIRIGENVRIAGYLPGARAEAEETGQEQIRKRQGQEYEYVGGGEEGQTQKYVGGEEQGQAQRYVGDGKEGQAQRHVSNGKEEQTQKRVSEGKEESADFYVAGTGAECEEVLSFDSKWDQLMHEYPQIHPFGDDRVFISIEPKDFIVLRASCQKLVNNSFLLHGFYNYRYLILGPDKELGDRNGECFYLGVPGTYFEREKMVAVMFGFEGFECAGAVEIGKFGFYMRRVEL